MTSSGLGSWSFATTPIDEEHTMLRSGLCLGGPLDGQYRAVDGLRIHVSEIIDLDGGLVHSDFLAQLSIRTIEYNYKEFSTPYRDYGFWIVADHLQRHGDVDIMGLLIKNYHPLKKKYKQNTIIINSKTHILHPVE